MRAGPRAERAAALHYLFRGYRILARNAWAGGNELDLVVRRGGRLVFVEVRARGRTDFGDPLETVGAEKQRRVRRAAEAWLAGPGAPYAALEARFDVVAVGPDGLRRVEDAF